MENKTWVKKQDPKFIKALKNIDDSLAQLSTHLYVMVSYFEQYVEAIQASPLYAPAADESKNDNEYSNPTQTFSEPAEEAK
jgi:hypothetical protein